MTGTTTDPVATYLAEVRERSEKPLAHATSLPITHDGVRGLMESAGDVTRLLAALEAVLDIHYQSQRPADSGPDKGKHWCVGCYRDVDHHILYTPWPCSTYRAISVALLGGGERVMRKPRPPSPRNVSATLRYAGFRAIGDGDEGYEVAWQGGFSASGAVHVGFYTYRGDGSTAAYAEAAVIQSRALAATVHGADREVPGGVRPRRNRDTGEARISHDRCSGLCEAPCRNPRCHRR